MIDFKKYENKNNLKQGYFGKINEHGAIGKYTIVEIELCDTSEGWECADWFLLDEDKKEALHIANCDGYNGVDYQVNDELLCEILTDEELDDLKEKVTSYEITGDLLAEAMDSTNEYVDDDDGYNGECKIWVEYCYSATTLGKKSDGFVSDDNGNTLFFASVDDAKEWLEEHDAGTYYLANGEMGRPTYRIAKA